jgi:hypothetical protein
MGSCKQVVVRRLRKAPSDPLKKQLWLLSGPKQSKRERSKAEELSSLAPGWYQRGLWQLCVSSEVKQQGTATVRFL